MGKLTLLALLTLGFLACEREDFRPATGAADRISAVVTDLERYALPLPDDAAALDPDDLAHFSYLGKARIVGLGEATHGSREFGALKSRLFRHLVEEHGFRAVVFEMDFAEALFLDAYVREGHGQLAELLTERSYSWIYRTETIRDLLVWLRQYNATRAPADRVRVLGNDAQTNRYNATALLSRLRPLDAGLAREADRLSHEYRQLTRASYATAGDARHDRIGRDLRGLRDAIRGREESLVAGSSPAAYELLLRLAENMIATEALLHAEHQSPYVNRRDLQLAANTEWWTERLGPDARTVFWGHNLHVADYPVYQNSGTAGSYLKDRYGSAYQSIGFSFSRGSFYARDPEGTLRTHQLRGPASRRTFAYFFERVAHDNFLLRAGELPAGSPADSLLRLPLGLPTIGATHHGAGGPAAGLVAFPLRPVYDAVVHFGQTRAAVRLTGDR